MDVTTYNYNSTVDHGMRLLLLKLMGCILCMGVLVYYSGACFPQPLVGFKVFTINVNCNFFQGDAIDGKLALILETFNKIRYIYHNFHTRCRQRLHPICSLLRCSSTTSRCTRSGTKKTYIHQQSASEILRLLRMLRVLLVGSEARAAVGASAKPVRVSSVAAPAPVAAAL